MRKQPEYPINAEVAAVIQAYPTSMAEKIKFLRSLIYETAASIEGLGCLEETLKWGEPSYLTPQSKMGSTLRIAWKAKQPDQYSIFFKCTANLVPIFKEHFSQIFQFGGNRSIDFKFNDEIPTKELKQCVALALTYHHNKQLETAERWKMAEKITQ